MLHARHRSIHLCLESLESRRLLTAAPAPSSIPYWQERFRELSQERKQDADIVLLGDSILDNLRPGTTAWDSHLSSLRVSNFAIGTSTVANVHWQVESGLLDGITPRVVTLLVGTNDLAFNGASPETVVAEVNACIDAIHATLPEAHVLVVGLLPRGETSADPFRLPITQINGALAGLQAKGGVVFVDVGAGFVSGDGQISADLMWDFVHPTTAGYEILARALADHLRCSLSVFPTQIPNRTESLGAGESVVPAVTPPWWPWLITADDETWD